MAGSTTNANTVKQYKSVSLFLNKKLPKWEIKRASKGDVTNYLLVGKSASISVYCVMEAGGVQV